MKRRDFWKTVATIAAPLVIPRHVLSAPGRPGANDRIRTGVIGCGSRSAVLLNQSPREIQIVALADCDLRQMGRESPFGIGVAGPVSDDFAKWSLYPCWMKDESAVVYYSDKSGKPQLYMYHLAGSSTIRVSTNSEATYKHPCGEATPK